jgi:LysR family glycine cleavage system transcriptional activator
MPVSLVRMPSVDLIKGFVAIGRRMSVSDAADDLCVTQSAISKQLRTLEESLGVRLLQRGHRKVSFTAEGDRLFRVADRCVHQLQAVLGTFGECAKRPVTITASMGVASLWLLPRLSEFQNSYPGIDLRVQASNRVLDLPSENIDLAIRYCSEPNAPRGAIRLFGEQIAPVCSPSLGLKEFSSLQKLKQQVLLEFEDRRPWLQWADWLAPRGLLASQARGILRFNQYDQAIYAALAGQGVALGRLELVAPMLADGRLMVLAPVGSECHSHYGYWMIQSESSPRSDVACVIDWLMTSAEVEYTEPLHISA